MELTTSFIIGMVICAVVSYLVGGTNGAIIFSKLVYHQDIRDYGSKNPGFTNFKRVYGNGIISWIVMIFDIAKTALCVFLTSLIFEKILGADYSQFGAAFSGLFCMIGHCFPVWYKFRGGKAFMAGFATTWFVNWRMALIAMGIFLLILFICWYMSIASCTASLACPVTLFILGNSEIGYNHISVWILCLVSALLVIVRHYPNFIKLKNHTESKFSLHK